MKWKIVQYLEDHTIEDACRYFNCTFGQLFKSMDDGRFVIGDDNSLKYYGDKYYSRRRNKNMTHIYEKK